MNNNINDKNINIVLDCINNNNWKKIYNLLKKKKIKPDYKLTNNKTLAHYASMLNNFDIIKLIMEINSDALKIIDNDGNTSIHIMALNKYYKLLNYVLKKFPKYINLVNEHNNTILHLIIDSEYFNWYLSNNKYIDFDIINDNDDTIITCNIEKYKETNDIQYFDNIKNILKHNVNINIPKGNLPLFLAIKLSDNDKIANLLINKGADINIKNNNFITPLIYAVLHKKHNLVKILINKGANLNYYGPNGDYNPLIISLMENDDEMANILIDGGFDINSYNKFIETPLHLAFSKYVNKNKILPYTICKLIYYGDMNIQNIKGKTPLHYFVKNFNWKNYDVILKNKKMDIFIKDFKGISPIEYINNIDISRFLDTIAISYSKELYKITNGKNNDYVNNNYKFKFHKCYSLKQQNINDVEDRKCINYIKKYILKTHQSIPSTNDFEIRKQLNLIKIDNVNKTNFNSDTLHNMIYTMIILKKYINLGVPFQYFIYDKVFTEQINQSNMMISYTKGQEIMHNLIKIYTNNFYEVSPYLIVWKSITEYYVHDNLDFHLIKSLKSDIIDFIFFKLTIISDDTHDNLYSTHANIIIYDKKNNLLERFEPYGVIPFVDNKNLDNFIVSTVGKIIEKYYKPNIKYFGPSNYDIQVSFQTISNDDDDHFRKLGDPIGFCLAWTFWYLEMRLNNPNKNPKQLIKELISLITKSNDGRGQEYKFIDYIRNYANKLDEKKNKYLLKAGFNEQFIYNISLRNKDKKKLIKQFEKDFKKYIDKL